MGEDRYLTAREAAGELGISTATLYAYVSRGLIRSEATGGKRRDRRYRAEDVSTLRGAQGTAEGPRARCEERARLGNACNGVGHHLDRRRPGVRTGAATPSISPGAAPWSRLRS